MKDKLFFPQRNMNSRNVWESGM